MSIRSVAAIIFLGGVKEFLTVTCVFLNRFGRNVANKDIYVIPVIICQSQENQSGKSYIYMREYLDIFSGQDFGRGNAHKSIPADYNFFENRHSDCHTLFGSVYFFCPYASHLMSYPSEIRCGISARTVLTIYEFSENSQWKDLCSSCGCE